jgi:hypothetical protein
MEEPEKPLKENLPSPALQQPEASYARPFALRFSFTPPLETPVPAHARISFGRMLPVSTATKKSLQALSARSEKNLPYSSAD